MPAIRPHLVASAALLSAACSALAQNVTVFGQEYAVDRIDYSASILLPNLPFPNDPPVPFIESEGIVWLGDNRVLMSADDIGDVGFGSPENWIIEARLQVVGGRTVGMALSRIVLAQDIPAVGYDLNPTGITLNTGLGFAGDGNIVALLGDGTLFGFNLATGAQLPFPPNSGSCLNSPGTCGINISGRNTNAEDVAYVPRAGGAGEFFVTNQDTESVERYDATTGAFISSFPVGGAVANGGIPGSVAKGLAYFPDSPTLPASLRRPEGIVIACFDRNFPALQAFDTSGNFIATQALTVDATAGGNSILNVSGCPSALSLESLTFDPDTGRIFLSNQGNLELCNYLFVLTPVLPPSCLADFNADGIVDPDDLSDYISCFFAPPPCSQADFNGDGNTDPDDLADFIAAFFGGCR